MNLRYQPSISQRDLRLDFLRGYFVFVMTIDHLRTFPAWTRMLTGGTGLWVTAAVGFILVSGLVMGKLYRTRITHQGWRWSISQVGSRALQLYVMGAAGRILFASGDYVLRYFLGRETTIPTNYWHLLEGAILQVRYVYGYVDLLPLYAILLLLGLGAIYFLQQGKWPWVIFTSALIWHVGRVDPIAFNFFRIGFRFAVWQFPFFIGIVFGYYQNEISQWRDRLAIPRWLISVLLISTAAAMLIISYQITYHHLWAEIEWVRSNSDFFNKGNMGPGRIMAALLIFAGTYEFVTQFWHILNRLFGWLLLLLGQNALTAYLIQACLSYFVIRLPGYPFPNHDPLFMGFWHLFAVLLVWAITRVAAPWLEKWPVRQRQRPSISLVHSDVPS